MRDATTKLQQQSRSVNDMPVKMTPLEERLWRYLVEHKTPVNAKRLAKHFLISESAASRALKMFADGGVADVLKLGSAKFYKVKE